MNAYGVLVITGALVWIALAFAFGYMLFEFLIVGGACAISIARWTVRDMRKHGRKPKWIDLPKFLLSHMFDMAGHRNTGRVTLRKSSGAEWRGIGDWTA